MFSCSKSEQKQLNTWVSFQSAEQPLLGQFSVSGNNGRFTGRFSPLTTGRKRPGADVDGDLLSHGWPSGLPRKPGETHAV
ncbi:hypothetical protein PspS34_03430 [Pseudomonas sp. S34]|nr:hypothetical protein PspS34_03430 [Pseudomonas sp. S34]